MEIRRYHFRCLKKLDILSSTFHFPEIMLNNLSRHRGIITRYLALPLALLVNVPCLAKKMQMDIESVILNAELIVVGEIISKGIGSYSFRIQETLHGDTSLRTIHVDKWKEWTCDTRSFEIAKGQRLVLLLGKGKSGYYPYNDSTGEIPITNDSLGAQNGYYGVLPRRLSITEFSEAVRALRSCCHITAVHKDFGVSYDWVWDCTQEERERSATGNDFTAWLFRRMARMEER
ncbi:MAG: hypothetical protein IPJ76_07100 [Flavobacteriales bacterium]|nr:MAG: hypothetical protein IPJ76_07100 [Flavobacteriales bacterium]